MSATPADRRLIQRSNCKADRLFFQLGRAFVSVQLSHPQVSCGRDPFLGVVPFCRRVLFRSCIPGSSVICRCPFGSGSLEDLMSLTECLPLIHMAEAVIAQNPNWHTHTIAQCYTIARVILVSRECRRH